MNQLNLSGQNNDLGPAGITLPISTATPTLSGFAMPLGGPSVTTSSVNDVHIPAPPGWPPPQQLQEPNTSKLMLPGRVTGPVRLIQQVASAWDLTQAEL